MNSKPSYYNVRDVWVKEINEKGFGSVPKILVGLKTDLRDGTKTSHYYDNCGPKEVDALTLVTFAQGNKLARKIGAVVYLECSAMLNEGVQELFKEAAIVASQFDSKGLLTSCAFCNFVRCFFVF